MMLRKSTGTNGLSSRISANFAIRSASGSCQKPGWMSGDSIVELMRACSRLHPTPDHSTAVAHCPHGTRHDMQRRLASQDFGPRANVGAGRQWMSPDVPRVMRSALSALGGVGPTNWDSKRHRVSPDVQKLGPLNDVDAERHVVSL